MLPNSWQNRVRWREKERERGKEEREESKGEKRLLKSEINKRLPVCLPCPPLFRQKSSLVFRLTWCNMDWAVSACTGAPLETHALLLFFFPQTPSCFWRNINPTLFQNFLYRKSTLFWYRDSDGTWTHRIQPNHPCKPPKQAFLTAFIFHIALSCFRAPVGGKLPVPFVVLG